MLEAKERGSTLAKLDDSIEQTPETNESFEVRGNRIAGWANSKEHTPETNEIV